MGFEDLFRFTPREPAPQQQPPSRPPIPARNWITGPSAPQFSADRAAFVANNRGIPLPAAAPPPQPAAPPPAMPAPPAMPPAPAAWAQFTPQPAPAFPAPPGAQAITLTPSQRAYLQRNGFRGQNTTTPRGRP